MRDLNDLPPCKMPCCPIFPFYDKKGNVVWKNASNDIKRVGNLMLKNAKGTELLNNMIGDKKNITLTVNTKDTPKDPKTGGNILGETTPTATIPTATKGGKTTVQYDQAKYTSEKIVLYEKNIQNCYQQSDGMTTKAYDQTMFIGGNNYEEYLGGIAVHEATHATDANSQQLPNPQAQRVSGTETKPLENQQEYYTQNLIPQ
jgi:hypothetical protein